MKLASLKGGRDGVLVVVSRDLARCTPAAPIARTMQSALDRWGELEQSLRELAERLESDRCENMPFEPARCAAPLPRAYHWADGSAYVNHVELVRKARGAELPASFWSDPLIYQGGSDDLLGPMEDVPFVSEEHGIDFEAEIAVVADDVPIGTNATAAAGLIRLVMLVNDWSLRNLIPGELAKGFGFYQSKPATACSPVAVTPEELGDAFRDGRVHRPLSSRVNGKPFGSPDAGSDMTFSFAQLIAHAARTRRLGAGAIVGSGTVSNYDRSRGSSCIVERRMLEQLEHGSASTPYLRFGDRVRIEMLDADGASIFGAIDQKVTAARI